MPKIFIVAGHTDNIDPGAMGNDTSEHKEVKKIAEQVVKQLSLLEEFTSYSVVFVPTDKTLMQKIHYINSLGSATDLVISLHMNAASARATGTETFYYGGNKKSEERAKRLQKGLAYKLGLKSRGVKADTTTRHKRLGIIRDTVGTAFLIELGFITNKTDLHVVRKKGAQAVIEGLRLLLEVEPVKPSRKLTESAFLKLLEAEATIDELVKESKQFGIDLSVLLKEYHEWDMRLDKERGNVLREVKKYGEHLQPELLFFEMHSMKKLALDNNEFIKDLKILLEKRKLWEKEVLDLRKKVKKLLP